MIANCEFCRLAHGDEAVKCSEWFTADEYGVVVEDTNPKRWAMRLLFVPRRHFHIREATPEWEAYARSRLGEVAARLEADRGLVIDCWDFTEFSCPWHWHAQLCLREA